MVRKDVRVYAVILVGGKGKRLKPLSTDARPKAFLSVTRDRKTMFKRTLDRISHLVTRHNIIVAANRRHGKLVRKDFPGIKKSNLILEPVSRNTAPAIALAAFILRKRLKDAVMVVLPSDQYILDEEGYRGSLKKGIDFVKENGDVLLTLGLEPEFPSKEFGYIRIKGQSLGLARDRAPSVRGVYKVEKFVEKPDINTAKKYIQSGRYLWNAGGFIFKASSILAAFKKLSPNIFSVLENSGNIDKVYRRLPDISIDYAIMEKADNIYCVRGAYPWQDIGSFESLKSILKRESRDFIERSGRVVKII